MSNKTHRYFSSRCNLVTIVVDECFLKIPTPCSQTTQSIGWAGSSFRNEFGHQLCFHATNFALSSSRSKWLVSDLWYVWREWMRFGHVYCCIQNCPWRSIGFGDDVSEKRENKNNFVWSIKSATCKSKKNSKKNKQIVKKQSLKGWLKAQQIVNQKVKTKWKYFQFKNVTKVRIYER